MKCTVLLVDALLEPKLIDGEETWDTELKFTVEVIMCPIGEVAVFEVSIIAAGAGGNECTMLLAT